MSRYSASAYNFHCRPLTEGDFILSWTIDFYYTGERCRFPRRFTRITNKKGAERFCKKHNLQTALSKVYESKNTTD